MTSTLQTVKQIGFFTIALTLALVANFAYGQWANPTAAPVGGNIAAPINEGGLDQIKAGDLGVSQLFADTMVRSNQYCDINGDNCFDPASAGGGGSSINTQLYSCPNVSNTAMTVFGCPSSCNGQVSTNSTCGAASRNSNNNRCEQVPVDCEPITITTPPSPGPTIYQCPQINTGCSSQCTGQLSTETTCSYIQSQGSDNNCSYPGANRTATCTPI